MLKLWIFLTFLCVGIRAFAESNEGLEDYDDYSDAATVNDENADWVNLSKSEDDLNKDVTRLQQFTDAISDYQIEDNISIGKEDKHSDNYEDDIHSIINTENLDADKESVADKDHYILNNINSQEIIQQILGDTKSILSEDTDNDFAEDTPIKDEANKNITSQYKDLIDEAKRLIEDTHDALDEDTSMDRNEDTSKVVQNKENQFDDLIHDIVELKEVGNNLGIPNNESEDFSDAFQEVYPSEEDYEELDDSNLERLFDKNGVPAKETENNAEVHQVEPFPDDSDFVEQIKKSNPILYHNDDLLPNEFETSQESEQTTSITEAAQRFSESPESASKFVSEQIIESSESVTDTRNMTDAQVDVLLAGFSQNNLKNIVSNAKATNNPQRIWLSVDKPTVITSPGYPSPYTTNTITDWILEGVATGIEFNVTDCAINGHIGDYLLVKPGRIDDSGSDGLIFTYTLNTERWYRFLDVDRLFMRFEAKPGMSFMRGFSISARMIVPAPVISEPEPDPVPPVITSGHSLTLNLGGISLEGFLEVKEQFRQIVADMATMYINANGINPGLNSTLEVTQITSASLCFHNWPKFENCAEVKFEVPLVLEEGEAPRLDEEDLHSMWLEYSNQDPFAVRLRMLGITEFHVPNDRGVLLVWLVIAGGVVISMAMLALALWRFSCIENYTRMPTFSDTDSLNEKRKMDMFPTPHQTLPPLFTEADYKWADNEEHCKVDVGGFSNRNFLQDDMFDIDSDEDIVPGRNRYTTDV